MAKADLTDYTDPIPDDGEIMTVGEFLGRVREGSLTDGDGIGFPARDGRMAYTLGTEIFPARPKRIPGSATHVVWFGKGPPERGEGRGR